jgi:peptidyl-prolyl cis-trans isomerase A (cyclophilin A)
MGRALALLALLSQEGPLLDPKSPDATREAPAEFRVKLETTQGDVVLRVTRAWAPKGADRFYNLVRLGYYDGARFYRVLPAFVAQVGIHGDPKVSAKWREAKIDDDPVKEKNAKGTITFAKGGPNSRTVNVFINLKDNESLDKLGFAPFGIVVEGLEAAGKLYSGYGDGAPKGRGPSQAKVWEEGNAYLDKAFPKLDAIKKATVLD